MAKGMQFEKSIADLDAIVKQLEDGKLPLESALKQFEKGIHLARNCQMILKGAEQTIENLTTNFSPPDEPIDE